MWGLIGSVYGWGGWLWLVWGRRGKAQVRELGRGQGNFKLAANFGYNSRGSADPRESLRKRRILKLALAPPSSCWVSALYSKIFRNSSIQNVSVFYFSIASFTLSNTLKLMRKDTEKTNVEGLLGKKAVVIQKINNLAQTGQVRINDIEWMARTSDDSVTIPVDTVVIIKAVHGVKLIVEPKEA